MSADDAVDPADLIPDARRWNDGRGIDPEGWIACIGSYELAVGYSLIFWPRFVRFEGYVLRDGFSEAALRGFERSTGRDRTAIEGVMNHLHLADLHPNAAATEGQLRHLGRVLREIHAAKLARDFPDLRFEIRFDDEPGLDPLLYELSFWRTG
ncbi:hypothetical protein [uncultured Methylobacterium sp.]|jgi:hypothetical protein|uniref:hypothetical protein n=1 Tax=uncultured Methylobacterium sp. TaxID=157278 RepID=UPI00261277D6|nr:hypothetical protein [uncultured Methylobacterium sp.]